MQSKFRSVCFSALFASLLALAIFCPGNCAPANNLFSKTSTDQIPQRLGTADFIYRSTSSSDNAPRSSGHSFILRQLYDDLEGLVTEPDFYGVMAGLSSAPFILGPTFRDESREFTPLWGSSAIADNFFEVGETVGNGAFPIATSVASWGIGKIAGSPRLTRFGSDVLRTQAVNGLLTVLLKGAIHRKRPNGGAYSYPSGHTSTAFAFAGTVYADLGKTPGIPAFILAGYVGISRLQEGKHYLSDVIAGGVLGTYVSLKLAHRTSKKGRLQQISISPSPVAGVAGLSLSFRF